MSQPKDDPLWKEAVASVKLTKHQDDIRRGLRPKPNANRKPTRFLPFAATCGVCDDLLVTLAQRQFVVCKCKATSLDAGDGIYWRCNGKVHKVWRLRKGTKAHRYTSWQPIDFPTK